MTMKQALIRPVVRQFGRPRGLGGALAGWVMGHRSSNVRRNEWVVETLALQPTDRVLEVGFGPGIAIRALARAVPDGRVVGVDASPVMLRQASRRNADAIRAGVVQLTCAPVDALPQLEDSFDAIVAVNTVGFWPEPVTRLTELRNRLRAGGRIAVASQPRCPGATAETSAQAAREIEHQLIQSGFIGARVETLDLDPPVVCVIAAGP
jgi:ubiquinone/menaquinone biosynthesis C-methylase UbiE